MKSVGYGSASGCNLSGSAAAHATGSSDGPLELTPKAALAYGTDPELLRVSDGDGLVMMTNAATFERLQLAATTTQKVVIVNGNPEMLETLETALDAGHYDVVFVESSEHAYSQIKRVQPNLVILCVRIDDANGFQVLSMLKLDDDTRAIPVLTYTSEGGDEDLDDALAEPSDGELFPASKAAVWMN